MEVFQVVIPLIVLDNPISLKEYDSGLFISGDGVLCVKTEYGNDSIARMFRTNTIRLTIRHAEVERHINCDWYNARGRMFRTNTISLFNIDYFR